ncbi:hypothetical protein [Ferruginibacter sp. HRS2-29]|nr:hypothetical protein [Ferruginibacter sp. HRS2-29]
MSQMIFFSAAFCFFVNTKYRYAPGVMDRLAAIAADESVKTLL